MEKKLWLALSRIEGAGQTAVLTIVSHLGSPGRLLHASLEDCAGLGIHPSKVRKILEGLKRSEPGDEEEHIREKGISIVTWADDEYPSNLRHIYDPPLVLYVKGQFHKSDDESIAVVGARKASNYGRSAAEMLAQALAERKITVVSGMARGIDACAHRGALAGGGRTIAVLGCGVDIVYPAEHRRLMDEIERKGAVVSEYPPGTKPLKHHFPARNRIIAGITLGTLVVEASLNSGSLITADFAMDSGREVFAVPGSLFDDLSKGPHRLVKEGAKLVENVEDILQELRIERASLPAPPSHTGELSEIEREILSHLPREGRGAAHLSEEMGIEAEKVLAELSIMEMKGHIRKGAGNLYMPAF
jgi:DNA processing protein